MESKENNLNEILQLLGHPQELVVTHDEIKSLLGTLPVVPNYNVGELSGGWSIVENTVPLLRGYYSSLVPSPRNAILMKDEIVWMSCTPMELESNYLPISHAHGNTLVCGLGMALTVLNMLHRGCTDNVVILEKSNELIEEFPELLDGDSYELWQHAINEGVLVVLNVDCLSDNIPVEYIKQFLSSNEDGEVIIVHLYIDIWAKLLDENVIPDSQKICNKFTPKEVSIWTQELELASIMMKFPKFNKEIGATPELLKYAINKTGITFSISKFNDKELDVYCRMINVAVYNVYMA